MKRAKTTHISLTEAKQRLGELVKRSAYGGERFVLEFRGKPAAVLTRWQDLDERASEREQTIKTLEALRTIREQSRGYSSATFDTTEEIRKLREGKSKEFDDMP